MIPLKYVKGFAVVLVALIFAFAGEQVWQHFHKPDFKPDIQKSERVQQTHKADSVLSAKTDTVVKTLVQTRTVYVAKADSTQHLAETLTLADTAKQYKLRWSLALQTDTLLRVALGKSDSALTVMTVDRNRWHSESDSAVDVIRSLNADLAKATHSDCRIVPFVRCPSRKEAFVGGVALGIVSVWKGRAIMDYLKGSRIVH